MTKLKLNLNKKIDPEISNIFPGIGMPNETNGQAIAKIILQSNSTNEPNIYKLFDWALQLGKNELLELDEGDVKILRDWVVSHTELFLLIKTPVLRELDKLDFKEGKK